MTDPLREELLIDPLIRGYAAMPDQEVIDDL